MGWFVSVDQTLYLLLLRGANLRHLDPKCIRWQVGGLIVNFWRLTAIDLQDPRQSPTCSRPRIDRVGVFQKCAALCVGPAGIKDLIEPVRQPGKKTAWSGRRIQIQVKVIDLPFNGEEDRFEDARSEEHTSELQS